MRGSSKPDWRAGKRRYVVHFSTGDAAMRWYDVQLEIGTVIYRSLVRGICEPGRASMGLAVTVNQAPGVGVTMF
jgi:hypothetical protein